MILKLPNSPENIIINPMQDVIVIGSGISGLSVAYRLNKVGVKVLVLEKEEQLGGNIQTILKDGFLCELGPQTILADREVEEFLKDAGISPEYASVVSKNRYVYKKGKLIPIPMSLLEFLTSPLLSISGKLRLLKEPFVPKSVKTEESIAEFVRRRLGEEFLNYLVAPFVSGVYAGDPKELSVKYAVRKVYELEQKYTSLIKGAIKLKALGPSGKLISFKGGNKTLIEELSKNLAVQNENVALRIRKKEGIYLVDAKEGKYEARAVVIASPAWSLGYLLRDISWSVAQEFDKVYYAPVVVVHAVVKEGTVPKGFGFLVPRVEKKRILGAVFSSQLFPGRAPEGMELLTIYLGGSTDPQIVDYEDDLIAQIVQSEIKEILGQVPQIINITKWKRGIPQYTLGYGRFYELADLIEKENPGLFLTGNYLRGVSVADCIRNSKEVAQKVLKYLS